MLPVHEVSGGVTFAARVQPGARREGVQGLYGEAVKIAVAAPPESGRANEALIRLLSQLLGVPRSSISILAGDSSRSKIIRVEGVTSSAVRAAFGPVAC